MTLPVDTLPADAPSVETLAPGTPAPGAADAAADELCWQKALLVVDGDPHSRAALCAAAEAHGWTTCTAATFTEAEALLAAGGIDCIVADTVAGGEELTPFLRNVAAAGHVLPVLIVSAAPASTTAALADIGQLLGLNMCYPIEKPIPAATLAARLTRIEQRLRDGIDTCCHIDCHWRKLPRAADAA